MQDSKGFIWFCTETGVNRFDGQNFESYSTNDGLADNENFESYEDSKGRIWFMSLTGKLSYYYKGSFYNEHNTPSLKYNADGSLLFNCAEDSVGRMWFSTNSGMVFCYDGKKTSELITSKDAVSGRPVFFKYAKTLMVLQLKAITAGDKKQLYGKNIYTGTDLILPGQNNKVGSLSALFSHYSQSGLTESYMLCQWYKLFKIENGREHNIEIPNSDRMQSFMIDGKDLWFGGEKKGLLLVQNFENSKLWKIQNLLADKTINHILKDHENNIWIATHGNGIYMLPSFAREVISLNDVEILSAGGISCMEPTGNASEILVGYHNGDLRVIKDLKSVQKYSLAHDGINRINDLRKLSDVEYLIGTDKGLYKLNTSTSIISKVDLQGLVSFKSFDRSNKDEIIFSINGRIIKKKGNGYATMLQSEDNSGRIVSLAATDGNNLYFGNSYGLMKLHGIVDTLVQKDDNNQYSYKSLLYTNKVLWAGTNGNGLFLLKDDIFIKKFDLKDGLTGRICNHISAGPDNTVWVATNDGITVFSGITLNILRRITIQDGLLNNDIKDIVFSDGKAYIGTALGISVFPQNFVSTDLPPQIHYTKVLVGAEKVYNDPEEISYQYFNGFVRILYAGISYISPQEVLYSYRFSKDSTWVQTNAKELTFFDLQPGNYTLLVRAMKPNSGWSNAALLQIIVTPLFYQAIWFKAILVLIFIAGIWYYLDRRTKAIRKKEANKLEQLRLVANLEAQALSSQLNPHFIFNSLKTLQHYIENQGEEKGMDYLKEFSLLMEQVLKQAKQNYIKLADELVFIKRYMDMEKVRFDSHFEYDIKPPIGYDAKQIQLPPMLLQPMLENAFKHAFEIDYIAPTMQVTIDIDKNFIHCKIEDNGLGIDTTRQREKPPRYTHTAMQVAANRLELMTTSDGSKGTIEIIDKSNLNNLSTGTIVILHIPLTLEQ
ncbi:MAG: histidine kinase [Bacteroidota bacterium]|nr:histidine kinase [Bacteroidota bacterium]